MAEEKKTTPRSSPSVCVFAYDLLNCCLCLPQFFLLPVVVDFACHKLHKNSAPNENRLEKIGRQVIVAFFAVGPSILEESSLVTRASNSRLHHGRDFFCCTRRQIPTRVIGVGRRIFLAHATRGDLFDDENVDPWHPLTSSGLLLPTLSDGRRSQVPSNWTRFNLHSLNQSPVSTGIRIEVRVTLWNCVLAVQHDGDCDTAK